MEHAEFVKMYVHPLEAIIQRWQNLLEQMEQELTTHFPPPTAPPENTEDMKIDLSHLKPHPVPVDTGSCSQCRYLIRLVNKAYCTGTDWGNKRDYCAAPKCLHPRTGAIQMCFDTRSCDGPCGPTAKLFQRQTSWKNGSPSCFMVVERFE